MATTKRATLIGATGLIGKHLLGLLQQDSRFSPVRILVRRPIATTDPKTEMKLVAFDDQESFRLGIEASDIVFCAIGTTQQKVKGDKQAYRKIDFDIAVNAARYCKETGCPHFILVSSVGANAASKNFYLQLKGQIEAAIESFGLPAVSIFRPSMLLGERAERRTGERFGQVAMRFFSFAIPPKYKAVEASDVAAAMVVAARESKPGFHVYEYADIRRLALRL
jgi:uncharacterized protein YbjT (DUF2867 family)